MATTKEQWEEVLTKYRDFVWYITVFYSDVEATESQVRGLLEESSTIDLAINNIIYSLKEKGE